MTSRPRTSRGAPDRQPIGPEDLAEVTTYTPAEWRKPWHRTADIGYPDYLPPRPGHDEEELTPDLIKNGFTSRTMLTTNLETFNAHNLIHDSFAKHGQIHLHLLGQLMQNVSTMQALARPALEPTTFKLPSRVTVHDSKRDAWIADLANAHIPLGKIASSSVPHPYKGHELLDMLHNHNIPISRAVWYVRVLGANETATMRARPNFKPAQYSIDFANIITSYFKKQLGEIVLPSALRPGLMAIRQTFQGALSDEEGRKRWVSRFDYSLSLLREFFAEALIDHATFLLWLSTLPAVSNLAQIGFVLLMVEEYFEELSVNRGLLMPLLEGCLSKVGEIDASSHKDVLNPSYRTLCTVIQRAFITCSDCFVNPSFWFNNLAILSTILIDTPSSFDAERQVSSLYEHIHSRNSALIFAEIPERKDFAAWKRILRDIQLLNDISPSIDLNALSLHYFNEDSTHSHLSTMASFRQKLDTLLTWASMLASNGHPQTDYAPYAASTALYYWIHEHSLDESSMKKRQAVVQIEIGKWLETRVHESAVPAMTNTWLPLLMGELVRRGIFDYPKFVRGLVASGALRPRSGARSGSLNQSKLLSVLKAIPLPLGTAPSIYAERVALLYGLDGIGITSPDPEVTLYRLQREWALLLPDLFDVEDDESYEDSNHDFTSLDFPSLFDRLRLIHEWLIPIIMNYVNQQTAMMAPTLLPEAYCALSREFARFKCYTALLDLSLHLLELHPSPDLTLTILDTFRMYWNIWSAAEFVVSIIQALVALQHRTALDSSEHVAAVHLLRRISSASYEPGLLISDPAKSIITEETGSRFIPQVATLLSHPTAEASEALVLELGGEIHTHPSSLASIWISFIISLGHLSAALPHGDERSNIITSYSMLFSRLHDIMSAVDGRFEELTLQWLRSDHPEFEALGEGAWSMVGELFLHLVAKGSLSIMTVMCGWVFPAWRNTSTLSSLSFSSRIDHANLMTRRMLLVDDLLPDAESSSLPPRNISDLHRLAAQRSLLNVGPDIAQIFHAAIDLIRLELDPILPDATKASCTTLRRDICFSPQLRALATQYMHVFRELYLQPSTRSADEDALIIGTLRLLLHSPDSSTVSSNSTSLSHNSSYNVSRMALHFNPWSALQSTIDFQLTLRQIGGAIKQPHSQEQASTDLRTFISDLVENNLGGIKTDMVADVLRGMEDLVSETVFSVCFEELTSLLLSLEVDATDALSSLTQMDEILRLLANVAHSMRNTAISLPSLPPIGHESFVQSISACISNLISAFSGGSLRVAQYHQITRCFILVARLIQFHLGLPGIWAPSVRIHYESLSGSLVRLCIIHAASTRFDPDPVVSSIVIDTTVYILSEIPKDPKTIVKPIDHPSWPDPTELPAELSPPIRVRLRFILSYHQNTGNLFYAQRASVVQFKTKTTQLVLQQPVQPKPWEWIEYTDPPPPSASSKSPSSSSPATTEFDPSIIRNIAALSLEHFAARATGERVSSVDERTTHPSSITGVDRLHGETVFERDWRASRFEIQEELNSAEYDAAAKDLEEGEEDGEAEEEPEEGEERVEPSAPLSGLNGSLSSSSLQPPLTEGVIPSRTAAPPAALDVDVEMNGGVDSMAEAAAPPQASRPNKRKASVSSDTPSRPASGLSGMIVEMVMPPSNRRLTGSSLSTSDNKAIASKGRTRGL